jgi:RNA polymerase sigma factor (sigma-70 family)
MIPMPSFMPRLGRLAPEDDGALLRRLAAGDLQALEHLYRRESGPVYRYALALCGNRGWSADAVQDAFMQLLQRPLGFDAARGSLGAYLAGIVRHRLLAQWREPLQAQDDEESTRPIAVDDRCAETLLVRRQQTDALWQALRTLPWVFREAVVLVDLQERPYAEAAQIAGVEINTLRTRLHRARQRLARVLGDEGELA